jgi:hypothetical protein
MHACVIIETDVPDLRSLNNERILSISFSRRIVGKQLEANGIETRTLFLEMENDESEKELLKKFDLELGKINQDCYF